MGHKDNPLVYIKEDAREDRSMGVSLVIIWVYLYSGRI
jgi:hypothetical protein